MAQYTHLIGAEQVQAAGHAFRDAADSFRQTVGWLAETLDRHERAMREYVERMERLAKTATQEAE